MMMDRIREARRGSMAGVHAGLSRRRQRSSLRDSLEEDGPMEVPEMGRLRDRGSKKDKDRDRSNRSKRRRGDRMMHGSHREDGEESSEESVDEEEDDEDDDASMSVRPPHTTPSASVIQNYHLRRGLPAKSMRPPGSCTWKVAEEMIGAPIPRKARSSSVKRSQECWVSGSGVDGGVEQVYRHTSTSPARPSPSSTAPASPSSSNASVRKKMKTISGAKHRPPKTSKSSSIQEIEIEVAEVLFGMTRQAPPKLENHKNDSKESNGLGNEVKSRVSSPVLTSSSPATSQPSAAPSNLSSSSTLLTTNAPKRKKPRMRLDEESLTSPPVSPVLPAASALKLEVEARAAAGLKAIAASPRSNDNTSSPLVDNGGVSLDPAHSNISSTLASPIKVQRDSVKEESRSAPDSKDTESRPEEKTKEDTDSPPKESPSHVNVEEPPASKAIAVSESPREEKFSIDLMAPTGKSSAEMENTPVDIRMAPKLEVSKGEGEKMDKKSMPEPKEIVLDDINDGNLSTLDCDSKNHACKERDLDVQPYEVKHQKLKQESRTPKVETIYDKAGPAASLPVSMQITGWPGGFPAFGYVGQVPPLTPVVPVDGSSTSSKTLQSFLPPQFRLKRCSTHCYVAQNILYHQQITRLNNFWPSAAGATPLYAPKQYNLNTVPPSDTAIHGSPSQGSSLPGKSLGSVQEKGSPATTAHFAPSTKDKSTAANPLIDGSQRKSQMLQQPSQPGSAGNMLAPAFIYPLNQHQAAAAGVAATNRSVVAKLAPVTGNAAQMSSNTSYGALGTSGTGGPGTSMSFNYPGLPPNEAQYLAFLQNNAYSFPIPTHVGGAAPYRGANAAQTMPFFNVSFYPPQMLHPSQIHQQPPLSQQSIYSQQGHQNPSTSSGSSSSQKNTQQSQKVPPAGASAIAAGNSRGFPPSKQPHLPHQTRHTVSETGGEDAPCTADSRALQDQKSIFTQKFSMPAHSQNFTLIAPSTAPLSSGGGNHSEKLPHHQTPNQVMKMDLIPSQAFAMSFASFGGASAAAGGAAPNGLDFSSIAQNHALLQSLPEAARHGYQISAAAAAAHHTAQQHPNKKSDDRRSAADLGNSTTVGEEGKVPSMSKASGNAPLALGNAPQQSLTFSKADKEASISSIIGNNLIDSSRTLNLIQPPSVGGARLSSRPVSAVPMPFSGTPVSQASNSLHLQSQQYQQQVLQLQKQEQQRAKPSASHNNATVYSDRLLSNSNASKFPQALGGFHPTLIQSSAPTQSPQWKASPRAATPASSPAPSQTTSPSVKNQISLQHQVRSPQPHQTQISFGVNPKASGQVAHLVNEGGGNAASLSPSATAAAGSSLNSVSKNLGVSPHSSSSTPKSGPAPPSLPVLPFQRPVMGKSPPSSSSATTSSLPAANRNMPSILGNPHTNPAASAKPQPPSQHLPHQLPKQQLPQPQFFFSNSYLQAQASQSDVVTAAAAYFQQHQQRRPTDQQQSQQQQNSGTNSTLSLAGSSSATLDQSKGARAVVPASNSKGSPSAGHTRHQAQLATVPQLGPGAAHPLMTAAAAAFPYIHTMQSVPVKPPAAATGAEQKPAAGL